MTGALHGGAQAGMMSLPGKQSLGALSAFPREQTVTSDSDQASPVCHLQEALLTPFTYEETEAQGHTTEQRGRYQCLLPRVWQR